MDKCVGISFKTSRDRIFNLLILWKKKIKWNSLELILCSKMMNHPHHRNYVNEQTTIPKQHIFELWSFSTFWFGVNTCWIKHKGGSNEVFFVAFVYLTKKKPLHVQNIPVIIFFHNECCKKKHFKFLQISDTSKWFVFVENSK